MGLLMMIFIGLIVVPASLFFGGLVVLWIGSTTLSTMKKELGEDARRSFRERRRALRSTQQEIEKLKRERDALLKV